MKSPKIKDWFVEVFTADWIAIIETVVFVGKLENMFLRVVEFMSRGTLNE